MDIIWEQDPTSGVAARTTSLTLHFHVETAEKAQVETSRQYMSRLCGNGEMAFQCLLYLPIDP